MYRHVFRDPNHASKRFRCQDSPYRAASAASPEVSLSAGMGNYRQTTSVDMGMYGRTRCHCEGRRASRKHGVSDADIWHAVRTAIRKIDLDDDLTMLIGPAQDGTPLEIGILDLNGEDPVVIHAMRLRPKFYPLIRQR